MNKLILIILFFLPQALLAQELSRKDYQAGEYRTGLTLDSILVLKGEPLDLKESDCKRCYEPAKNTIVRYDGMELWFSQSGKSDKAYLYLFSLTKDSLSTPRNISIGSTKEEIVAAYGEPIDELWHWFKLSCDNIVSYYESGKFGDYTTTGISFCLQRNKVVEIMLGQGSP
ncbi:hypothetical protein [Gracilimonas sediminicola]|uniref:Uncharacterized protein n=1 Tax=Gracilimonas sediminicola TaxID=2952158 RepID=A0A9X2L4E1_9BACT|nr:hypothetical protein [Gracilimonas sediminicola]MCP9292089.1 hypothetical protein [Gracilimonas sediminicola]